MQALNQPIAKTDSDSNADSAFNDATIEVMKEYFHVQDRDVLMKYLRDTLAAPGGK